VRHGPRIAKRRRLQPDASDELDRSIRGRMRLGILSAVAVSRSPTCNGFEAMFGATDGNPSVHARLLEDAGCVDCSKGYLGRAPRTKYSLPDAGRAAPGRCLDRMESLLRTVREA
jgi:hypothetical protein